MDKETINSYNREAKSIAQLHSTLTPYRIYELIDKYFTADGTTADIGCGIGRDTHWLNQQGFPTIGVDASGEMLKQARLLYPNDKFVQDDLPELNKLGDSLFQNILCSAVLMHLNKNELIPACNRLLQLLNENSCMVVSFRSTNEIGNREKGKLYEPIDIEYFLNHFKKYRCAILLYESVIEASRNIIWQNLVIRKTNMTLTVSN